jgi:hypothetical protein
MIKYRIRAHRRDDDETLSLTDFPTFDAAVAFALRYLTPHGWAWYVA